jgi:hypothetical protein
MRSQLLKIMDILGSTDLYFTKIVKSICKHEQLDIESKDKIQLANMLADMISECRMNMIGNELHKKMIGTQVKSLAALQLEDEDDDEDYEDEEDEEEEDDEEKEADPNDILEWQWECHDTFHGMEEVCEECGAWHCDCEEGDHPADVKSCDRCGGKIPE